jgi:hypothetical protein
MEDIAQRSRQLEELTAAYSGWKFGLGGSGNWWAVRRNELLRAPSREELEAKLRQHIAARQEA